MKLNELNPLITLYSNHFNGLKHLKVAPGSVGGEQYKLSKLEHSDGGVQSDVGAWSTCPCLVSQVIERCTEERGLVCVAKIAKGDSEQVATVWICETKNRGEWLDTQLRKSILDSAAKTALRFNLYNPDELKRKEITRCWLRIPRASVRVINGAHSLFLLLSQRQSNCVVFCFEQRRWQWEAAGFTTIMYNSRIGDGKVYETLILDDIDALFEDARWGRLASTFLDQFSNFGKKQNVWALRASRAFPPFITWVRYMNLARVSSMADFISSDWRWTRARQCKVVPTIQLQGGVDKMAQIGTLKDGSRWLPVGIPQHLHPMPDQERCTICMNRMCNVIMSACRHIFCEQCFWANVRASRGNACMLCRCKTPIIHQYNSIEFTSPKLREWMEGTVPVFFVDTHHVLPEAFVEYMQRRVVTTLHEARNVLHRHVNTRWVIVDNEPPEWLHEVINIFSDKE